MTDNINEDIRAIYKELEVQEENPVEKEPPVEAEKKEESPVEKEPPVEAEKKEEPPVEKEPDVEPEKKEEPLLAQDKAPSAWSPAAREKWNDIPKEIRDEIVRREDAGAKGVRQLQEKYAPLEQAFNTIQPFIDEARQAGLDGGQYIARTMAAERNLRHQDMNIRFGQLLEIADTYGIPLRDTLNKLAGQKVVPDPVPPQLQQGYVPPHIQQELEQRRKSDETRMEQEVAQFAEKHEFFQDVKEAMADLIDLGRAKTLEEAYELAVSYDANVQNVLNGRKAKEIELQNKQSRASGAKVKGTGEDVDPSEDKKEEDMTLEELVRKQMKASTDNRV